MPLHGKTNDRAIQYLCESRDISKQIAQIKGSAYALGKAPEHLTEKQQLRLLLKLTNAEEAKSERKRWLWKASHSRIPAFKELYQKIRRHKTHTLNTIHYGMSNARIEATNNKIKLIIRKAYGFRNIQNMLDKTSFLWLSKEAQQNL